MAPKAPEKSPQQQQPPNNVVAVVAKHSNPFYISAHTLCNNRRLKQKRARHIECIRNALSQHAVAGCYRNNKTEVRRRKLSLLRPEVTIDLLSDDENQKTDQQQKQTANAFPGRMCLERAAILGLMPVDRLSNGPPPLVPFTGNKQKKATTQQQHSTPQPRSVQQIQQQQPRKRKSRPQKRCSLPVPVLLNSECIVVLSDDSDTEKTQSMTQHPQIPTRPDLAVIYPTSQSSPCQQPTPLPLPPSLENTMQVDEEVTISLVPRSLTATTCARARSSLNTATNISNNATASAVQEPPFPMLPDETTVHTVIANRIYELSLTKLREGLASCGIPEFNGGQQKISPPRRKGAVKAPPIVTQPQAPISLKLSSDLSISLISDDEDDMRHHRKNEALLSPAFLQKLPVNVSIAPVLPNRSHTPASVISVVDPRKLKFG